MYTIEVAYALPDEQIVIPLRVSPPLTIRQAIEQSGILQRFPDLILTDDNVGVFGYRHSLSHQINDLDRVEVYRPLEVSPTEARRLKAAARAAKKP